MTLFIAKTSFAMKGVQMYTQRLRRAQRLFATLVGSNPRCQRIESCSELLVLLLDGRVTSKTWFVFIVHSNRMMGRVWKNIIESSNCLQRRAIIPGSRPHGCTPSKPNAATSAHLT